MNVLTSAAAPRIKTRRLDTPLPNRWEFSINGRVRGRARSDSAARKRAQDLIEQDLIEQQVHAASAPIGQKSLS